MTETDATEHISACRDCLRRSWLLSELSALLDYQRGRRDRLLELLELPDEHLIQALAGRRRAELEARHRSFDINALSNESGTESACSHDSRFASALASHAPPIALHIGGDPSRIQRLLQGPVVSIIGSRRPSDYGRQQAAGLARGLAASGITVAARLELGIAEAALRGATTLEARTLAIAGDGLGVVRMSRRSELYEEATVAGCTLSQLPGGASGRGWGTIASEWLMLDLASLVVLIEADLNESELTNAHAAKALGHQVAALPGRVTSPLARGPHTLLLEGAALVTGAKDVLELLSDADAPDCPSRLPAPTPGRGLPARLRGVLERVLAGCDTPEQIEIDSMDRGEILTALSELEIASLLRRAPGGRYIPQNP